jgi:putative membrane protein
MVQHLLLGMFGPLALVLAAPVTLLLGMSSTPVRRGIGTVLGSPYLHVLVHPFTAAALNVGTLYLLYLTPVYAAAMSNSLLHALVNVHFVLAGSLFVWAIAGPDPAKRRPGMLTRLAALFLSTAAHGYLAKLLYAHAGSVPPAAGHVVAQNEQAAQWMYYGGDLAELLLAVALFTAWYRGRLPVGQRSARSASTPQSATWWESARTVRGGFVPTSESIGSLSSEWTWARGSSTWGARCRVLRGAVHRRR